MYHSLALVGSDENKYRPIREAENVWKLVDLIDQVSASSRLLRHRVHARFEIDNIDEVERLKKRIAEKKIHLISFMDHTPGQGQFRDLEVYKKKVKGYNGAGADMAEIMADHQAKQKLTIDAVREIARFAQDHQIAIASHDDDTVEKLEAVVSFGAAISEFPITLEVAGMAKRIGMMTVAGAPNVILGGSHSGNLSAAEGVRERSIDILCSDYYPAAMLHAVFQLVEQGYATMVDAIKMITLHPAKAVRIDKDYGSIREGKKADLLVLKKTDDGLPTVTVVWVDGKLVQKTNYWL